MRVGWLLLSGLLVFPLACGDDDDDDSSDGGAGRAGATAQGGRAGGGGQGGGGQGGKAQAGQGGTAGGRAGGGGTDGGIGGAGGTAGASDGVSGDGFGGAAAGAAGEGGSGGGTGELTDGQVLKIFDTANLGEVEQGELALDRAKSEAVLDYAQMMVTQHTAAHEKGTMLAQTEGITLVVSTESQALQSKSDAIVNTLEDEPEATFDLAYMESQVAVHGEVLTLLDETLIPEADTEAVEQLLTEARGTVAEHLEMAEDIVDTLD